MNIRVNDPNLWAAAIWYMENSGKFHGIMKKIEPMHKKVAKAQDQNTLELTERSGGISEKLRAHFENELMHSVLAAYLTYQRGLLVGDAFYEKAKLFLHDPLQLPPPRVMKRALTRDVYAYIIWTMPPEIDYAKGDQKVQQLPDVPVSQVTLGEVPTEETK